MYVFGYGSLVSPASVSLTLGRPVGHLEVVKAHLTGWRRSWNVGTDQESHPERTFFSGGVPYTGLAVVLGIETVDDGTACSGAVFRVGEEDLGLLDVRERNYHRIDVTGQVTGPVSGVVYAYVPRERALERVRLARANGRPAVVRREYFDLVERAFESVGELTAFRATTPPPDVPIVSLDVVSSGPVRQQPPQ